MFAKTPEGMQKLLRLLPFKGFEKLKISLLENPNFESLAGSI